MSMLQDENEKTVTWKEQGKKRKGKILEGEKQILLLHDFSFSFKCERCHSPHKGTVKSNSEDLEIICKEPLEDDMISVTDDEFVLWLAKKQKGQTLCCDRIHYLKGRLVKNANGHTKKEGRHTLYEGEFDDEMITLLEDRAKRRSMYL